jgi:hypothetical protein
LSEWHALGFEEKRAYHEQFARGFEAYLFEGKAPSIELQGMFQRFRAWMLAVYRELKNLNVDLTDEVRSVFDRMLASTEQITLAEQGRSMMPLFTAPEQAGMTPEEFAAYQALGTEATADAIDDLQARGLRDMTWLHNARGRIIKQLQKDAKAQRAAVEMDVRREVMSQPIYRAWSFLTNKIGAEDKIAPTPRAKSDPNRVDETQDSLFTAIAKLGGVRRDLVQSEWGIDPKERLAMPVFGKHVLRREGGLTIDGMAEALSQYGYLSTDEHGKWDLREFEDKFFEELRGVEQYSVAFDYDATVETRPGDQVVNPQALAAGRLDRATVATMDLPPEVVARIEALRMTRKDALHPDIVAEMFGFSSGDELVRKLAAAETPRAEISALTDVRMLEQFGDLSSPEAIEKAADKAIHNDARARFVATEANALAKATGQRKVLASAAKEFARAMIARLKVRNVKPSQYANAEVRAAKASEQAIKAGDLATAAAEKRNQLIQNYATRAAYDAQEEVDKGLRYVKKFESEATRKGLDADYTDQIDALLERFDLRKGQSNKAVDKRTALAEWIKAQREAGLEPDIPPALENEAFRESYKNLTVEEFRGLVDTVRQIEHLGRLKHKLLTTRDQRAYEAVRDEIAGSIREHSQGREADTRTPTTNMGRAVQGLKRFWASHIKAATWARVMDGGKDGGPHVGILRAQCQRTRRPGNHAARRSHGHAVGNPRARVCPRQDGRQGAIFPEHQPQPEPRGAYRPGTQHGQHGQPAAATRGRRLEHAANRPGAAIPDRARVGRRAGGVGSLRKLPPADRREGTPGLWQRARVGESAAVRHDHGGRSNRHAARRVLPNQIRPGRQSARRGTRRRGKRQAPVAGGLHHGHHAAQLHQGAR